MICPVCLGENNSKVREIYDDRYGQPDIFNLVRCTQCGHLMTSPRLAESQLGDLYSTYYPRKHVNIDDLKYEAALSVRPLARLKRWWFGTDNQGQYTVSPGEKMLDIGCGSGLSLLEAKAVGAEVRGIEADTNVKRIAHELDLKIHIGSLLDNPFPDEKFDLIVLNQVIEHIPDPGLTLKLLRSKLKNDGRIVLVFPNVKSLWCRLSGVRWINWHVPYHLHHFTLSGFTGMAIRNGYTIKKVRTITPNLWTVLQLRANKIKVDPGKPSPLWTVSESSSAKPDLTNNTVSHRTLKRLFKGALKRSFRIVSLLSLSLINRLVDAACLGDSLMVEIMPKELS